MIKFLLNIVRIIISIYLCALIILTAYFLTMSNLYEDVFPFVFDYSYFKIDNDYLKPDYENNDYILVKKYTEEKIEEGDYIIYLEDAQRPRLKKVTKVDDYLITLNYPNKNEENTIDVKEVVAKFYYTNSTISSVLNIVTNPVVVILLFIAVILLPELTYKRY